MNDIESDADLLIACRTRQHVLDDIEDIADELDHHAGRQFLARHGLCAEPNPIADDIQQRHWDLQRQLRKLTTAIADAVTLHLMNPAPPIDRLMEMRA